MNTPVTHGSGTMVVTATGAGTELGKISGMLSATAREESPLTREMNRLTLWIAAAAGLTMIVMFALGRARGQAWDHLFTAAVSLAIAAIPEALPTVTQTILSVGGAGPGQAQRDRAGPALGRDAGVHLGDQLRQDRHADHEPDDRGRGGEHDRPLHDLRHRLRPGGPGPSRRGLGGQHRGRDPALSRGQRRQARRAARSSAIPPRGPCWCWATRPGWTSTRPASGCPGWPRCRSTRRTS